MTTFRFLATVLVAASLMGCASVSSVPSDKSKDQVGLRYYLPMKDIIVTMRLENGEATAIDIDTTPAYPDLTHSYVLSNERNLVGSNKMDVVVSNGLLGTATTSSVSGVSDALKNLLGAGAWLAGAQTKALLDAGKQKDAAPVCPDGDYVFRFFAKAADYDTAAARDANGSPLCGLQVKIELAGASGHGGQVADKPATPDHDYGFYYRDNLPYLVFAHREGKKRVGKVALKLSPSESPTGFLPLARSAFANTNANFAFADGVPTKFQQDTDSELVAFLALPADVIAAYMSAVGSVFDAFRTKNDQQAALLASQTQLQLAQQKYAACLAAIQSKQDAETLQKLGCGN